uniref:Uncharacterized protein n=1 Tax=Arundo donax TaxID=35708 RepID=A0A0A9HB57_ARUDO
MGQDAHGQVLFSLFSTNPSTLRSDSIPSNLMSI